MQRLLQWKWLLLCAVLASACQCGDISGDGDVPPGETPTSGTPNGDPPTTPVTTCSGMGEACGGAQVCCTGVCAPSGVCEQASPADVHCAVVGESCRDALDCCNQRCEGGTCSAEACKDNGAPCADPSECCTATCNGGVCGAIQGTTSTCSVLGQSCTSGPECCSTNCKDNKCAAASTCQATDDLCFSDTDCCSFLCSKNDGTAGYCRAPSGGCTQDGLPCSSGTNCCSRVCADPGTGVTVCLSASGCRMTGASCLDDQNCCGGGTNPNGSVQCTKEQPSDSFGRCDNGESCNPPGNICGATFTRADGSTFSVNASQNCCDGKKESCKLDSSGIPRCFGGGSTQCPSGYTGTSPCCISEGQICQFKDQCCDGSPCIADDDGVLRCTKSTCVPLGTSCTPGESQCCSGSCTANGEFGNVCATDTEACKPNGQSCANPSDCCSGACNGGLCAQPVSCQAEGGTCSGSSDCCSGTSCVVPSGSLSGTCQASSCASSGQACSPSTVCCNGLNCMTSSYAACDGTAPCACVATIN